MLVLHVSPEDDVLVLESRRRNKNSRIGLLDRHLTERRCIGQINWAGNMTGTYAVDHSQQTVYVCSDGCLTSTKAWRSWRPRPS
jgi:hypothetical protein